MNYDPDVNKGPVFSAVKSHKCVVKDDFPISEKENLLDGIDKFLCLDKTDIDLEASTANRKFQMLFLQFERCCPKSEASKCMPYEIV